MPKEFDSIHPITLYIVRHGESESNIARVFRNPMTVNLTEKGKEQAELLGKRLSNTKFSRVYCSDFPRAVQTAQIVLANSTTNESLNITYDERIREQDHRDWEGKLYTELRNAKSTGLLPDDKYFPYRANHVPGMESVPEMLARLDSFIDDLLSEKLRNLNSPAENILIVGHGILTQLWTFHLFQSDKYRINDTEKEDVTTTRLQNCAFHEVQINFDWDENTSKYISVWKFVKSNEAGHLLK